MDKEQFINEHDAFFQIIADAYSKGFKDGYNFDTPKEEEIDDDDLEFMIGDALKETREYHIKQLKKCFQKKNK